MNENRPADEIWPQPDTPYDTLIWAIVSPDAGTRAAPAARELMRRLGRVEDVIRVVAQRAMISIPLGLWPDWQPSLHAEPSGKLVSEIALWVRRRLRELGVE